MTILDARAGEARTSAWRIGQLVGGLVRRLKTGLPACSLVLVPVGKTSTGASVITFPILSMAGLNLNQFQSKDSRCN